MNKVSLLLAVWLLLISGGQALVAMWRMLQGLLPSSKEPIL